MGQVVAPTGIGTTSLRVVVTVALLFLSFSARADWGVVGAATRCDEARGVFVIAPVVELGSEDRAAVPIQDGFSEVPRGAHELGCTLRGTAIATRIRVYPPDAGACMGAGYVSVDSLVVGGSGVIAHPTAFNWQCQGEDILIRLEVAATASGLALTTCTARDWAWGVGFSGVECSTRSIR